MKTSLEFSFKFQLIKVKSFVNDLANSMLIFDLVSGRYVIDAKIYYGYLQPGSVQADRSETSMQKMT